MQRAFFIKLCVFLLLGICSAVQASNVMPYVINSHDFYRSSPDQLPLSEQMTAVINSPPIPLQMTQLSPIRVAFLFSRSAQDIRNTAILRAFEERMQELGIAYQLVVYDKLNGQYFDDPYKTIEKNKPDYLIATQLDMIQSRVVEQVLHKGFSKVIFFNLSTPLDNWKYHPPLMYIGFDQEKVATTLASYVDRQLPKSSTISALVLPSGYLNDVRCNRFLDAVAGHGRHVDVVQTVPDDQKAAFKAAQRILQKTPDAFIFSCTQAISDGVVKAIIDNDHAETLQNKVSDKVDHTDVGKSSPDIVSQNTSAFNSTRGVVLQEMQVHEMSEKMLMPTTNSWGLSANELSNLSHRYVLVSSLFTWDDAAIAVAEGIKGDMEGRSEPTLYVGRTSIMSPEQDLISLQLMLQQAYRYSAVLK